MTNSSASDEAASKPRSGFRLPRAARLRRSREIRHVQRRGQRIRGSLVDLCWAPSGSDRPRVAVVVPRYGRTAVDRNRVRRRLLEIARTVWMPRILAEHVQVDLVFQAKPAAYEASYSRLRESLKPALEAVCGS